jgi:hypothetical protein
MDKANLGKEGANFNGTGTHFMTFYLSLIAGPRSDGKLDLGSVDSTVLIEAQRLGLPILRPHLDRSDREPDYASMMKKGYAFRVSDNKVTIYLNGKPVSVQRFHWLKPGEAIPEPVYAGGDEHTIYSGGP